MMEFNERVRDVLPSATLALTSKAKAMKAAGEDVCSFGAGEPDFDTPDHVKQAAITALTEGQTKYAPSTGLPALRDAISAKFKRENGLDYAPQQIIVSNGAKHSLYNALIVICHDGDEILLPTPSWLSYEEMVRMAGAKSVYVKTRESDEFALRKDVLEAAITPKTRAIILNSPSNPTGMVYDRATLEMVAELAVKHDFLIIADEIYEKLLYDGVEHISIGSLNKEVLARTITINGLSKAYAMTGWRLGYMGAPMDIAKKVGEVQSHATSGPNTFAMYGALAAMTGPQDCVESMRVAFDERRNRMYELLMDIKGIQCVKPRGAFYMFPNISCTGLTATQFAERLLNEEKVAVVPCEPFGAPSHVRLSYACSMKNIEKGLARFKHFVESL